MTRSKLFLMLTMAAFVCAIGCGGGAGPDSGSSGSGSKAPPPPEPGFTLVVLPDTQCYTSQGAHPVDCLGKGNMEMFHAQMDWITSNPEALGINPIAAVVGVGDIVQCGDDLAQWQRADSAYAKLDAKGIPYVAVLGNHDYDNACGDRNLSTRDSRTYNLHFGKSRLAKHSWWANDTVPDGTNDNFYITFDAAGEKFLVLALEPWPRDSALQWAAQRVSEHQDRHVIVTTHSYLTPDGQRMLDSDATGPERWNLAGSAGNNGEELWQNFLRKHKNIIVVLSGNHEGSVKRVDLGDAGNRVAQMRANFQFDEGGKGYLRILHFKVARRVIETETFSPFTRLQKLGDNHRFTIEYGMP